MLPEHPLHHGHTFQSLGGHFTYRVVGPCCRLFDREELPWPCCRVEWRGKEPSWRRIGKRFVLDLASRNSPSYSVEIVGQHSQEPMVLTLYWAKLSASQREWWYSHRRDSPLTTHILEASRS
ncbi:MAG: hypothetical protein HC881_05560 [Leptolyngbyaceae cyanobacterium SL_7_1]|nr:hypothetical protein [Leptolyngbyaceae cyanobacterium SL_7_1]